jgi:hypothetical protein
MQESLIQQHGQLSSPVLDWWRSDPSTGIPSTEALLLGTYDKVGAAAIVTSPAIRLKLLKFPEWRQSSGKHVRYLLYEVNLPILMH